MGKQAPYSHVNASHTHTHTEYCVLVCTHTFVYIYICVYIYIMIYIYTYVYILKHMCWFMHTYIPVHCCIHVYLYIEIQLYGTMLASLPVWLCACELEILGVSTTPAGKGDGLGLSFGPGRLRGVFGGWLLASRLA